MADTHARSKLLELAASRFDSISPAEQKLFDATANGKDADCTSLSEKDRVIQAERLLWLCTDPYASALVTYRGVAIIRAEIGGEVNLEWAKISFPLRTRQCVFTKAIILQNSHVVSLDLADTSIKDLRAEGVIVERSVILSNGFKCEGSVNLARATIGGDLMCAGGKFLSADGLFALDANNANIQGDVFLSKGFRAEGRVDILGATIGGKLVCGGGQFVSVGGKTALDASFAKIRATLVCTTASELKGEWNSHMQRSTESYRALAASFSAEVKYPV